MLSPCLATASFFMGEGLHSYGDKEKSGVVVRAIEVLIRQDLGVEVAIL